MSIATDIAPVAAASPPRVAPATGGTPILEIKNLGLSYYTRAGEIPAVKDFNMTLNPGESLGIVGESGCGKSTVAFAIMQHMGRNGALVEGSIKFKGRDMSAMGDEELRNLRGAEIAMIYQEPFSALNPSMTVGNQLMEVPLFHEAGCTPAEARDRSIAILEKVRLPDPHRVMAAWPHQLSGGQQQRVVIAMALLSNPSLLLLDEPTTALDVTVEAGIVDLIRDIRDTLGTSMIYISHNLGLILETCDRVCVMYSGQAVEMGSVSDVFDHMRHPYTRGLFSSIPLPAADKYARPLKPIRGQLPLPHQRPPGCVFGPRCDFFEKGRCDNPPKVFWESVSGDSDAHPESHHVRCARWRDIDWDAADLNTDIREPVTPGKEILSVKKVQKYYELPGNPIRNLFRRREKKWIKAVESLSFDARKQEIVAIVGESGCGKSTFAKVLMGLEEASSGKIHYQDADIAGIPAQKRGHELIGSVQMIFQNPNDTLNPSFSVGRQIGRVIRKFGGLKSRSAVNDRVHELLDLVKLPAEFASRKPRQLSGGQKQRIGIARAFAGNPAMIVADEPVSALDVSVQAAVTDLLMNLQSEYGTTLLFISHDLSVVRYLADRVVVMYLGRIMEQGTVEQVYAPPYHPYTEALLSAVPIADTSIEKRHIILEGSPPSVLDPPPGCPFATRCPRRIGDICDTTPPVHTAADGHRIACHIPLEELKKMEPVIVIHEEKSDS